MSLRYGLLGLLSEGPASGYDLARRFEDLLSEVWPAKHPQIYQELGRLAADGLIEVDSEGPRSRKSYRITEAGSSALHDWLLTDPDHTLRFEPILRSLFFWLLAPDELDKRLEIEARRFRAAQERFEQYAAAKDAGVFGDSPATRSMRIALEAGIRATEAFGDWAEWARTAALDAQGEKASPSKAQAEKKGPTPAA